MDVITSDFSTPSRNLKTYMIFPLGIKELSPPALNLKRLVKDTVPGEAILIVISPGADPSQVIQFSLNPVVWILCYQMLIFLFYTGTPRTSWRSSWC